MSQDAIQHIKLALSDTDWSFLDEANANGAYNQFITHVNFIIDKFAPEKLVSIQPKFIIREQWMTKGLMTLSKSCMKQYSRCKKITDTEPLYVRYLIYRNLFNKLKYAAKKQYYIWWI